MKKLLLLILAIIISAALFTACNEKAPSEQTAATVTTAPAATQPPVTTAAPTPDVILTKLTVVTPPDKTEYYSNENIDPTGGKIKVEYQDGHTETLDMTADMFASYNKKVYGEQLVALSYTSGGVTKTATVEFNILEAYTVRSGDASRAANGVFTSKEKNTLIVFPDRKFKMGEYSADISIEPGSKGSAGIVFAYGASNGKLSYYRFCANTTNHNVEIYRHEGSLTELIYSNYYTAGFRSGASDSRKTYTYKVIIEDGKAYCWFYTTLYAVIDIELDGTGCGVFSTTPGSEFKVCDKIKGGIKSTKADTVVFGHSYTEMWYSYKTDLANMGLGKIENIGIGGAVAVHWEKLTDSIVSFEPTMGIYNIGINDYSKYSPKEVADSVERALLDIKERIPEFRVVLVAVCHCPARTNYKNQITETNKLYKKLAEKYDWVIYADVENVFNDANGVPQAKYFLSDKLHPNNQGYALTAKVIKEALGK